MAHRQDRPRRAPLSITFDRRLLWLAAGLIALVMLGSRLESTLTVFGVSFLIAYLLDPLADRLEARGLGRTLSVAIIFLVFCLSLAGLFWLIVPLVLGELSALAQSAPSYVSWAQKQIMEIAARTGVSLNRENLLGFLVERLGTLSQIGQDLAMRLSRALGSLSGWVLELSLIPVLVFYFLRDFDRIMERILANVQARSQHDWRPYYLHFNRIVASYFRGQLIVSAFLALGYSSVLLLVGISPAITLGIIAGILGIVPYLGLVIGLATAILLAVMQYADWLHPLLVLLGFSLVQAIEGNYVTPKVVGSSIGLHPAAVIFALMAGGTLFGIGGMIVALPIAAFLVVLMEDVWGLSLREDPPAEPRDQATAPRADSDVPQ